MDATITTPRLKLTLVTTAPRNSEEFAWIHKLRSNEQSSWWSLHGPSKTLEDTEKALQNMLAVPGFDTTRRFPYAVHEQLEDHKTCFIGMITLRTLSVEACKFPPRDKHGSTSTTLSLEIAYMFLPESWGHGYATESISALLRTCASSPVSLWAPYTKIVIRAIVNDENLPSQRVMEKCGMSGPEVLEFEGGTFFIAGKWRSKHRLFVYEKKISFHE